MPTATNNSRSAPGSHSKYQGNTRQGKKSLLRRTVIGGRTYWTKDGRTDGAAPGQRPDPAHTRAASAVLHNPGSDVTKSVHPMDWKVPVGQLSFGEKIRRAVAEERGNYRSSKRVAKHNAAADRGEARKAKQLAHENKLLTADPSTLSDRDLYKARDLARQRSDELKQATNDAPDEATHQKMLDLWSQVDTRRMQMEEAVRARDNEGFQKRWRRNLVVGHPKLAKAVYGRKLNQVTPGGGSRSAGTGFGEAIPDKTGKALTGWFDGIWEFFSKVWRSRV